MHNDLESLLWKQARLISQIQFIFKDLNNNKLLWREINLWNAENGKR